MFPTTPEFIYGVLFFHSYNLFDLVLYIRPPASSSSNFFPSGFQEFIMSDIYSGGLYYIPKQKEMAY